MANGKKEPSRKKEAIWRKSNNSARMWMKIVQIYILFETETVLLEVKNKQCHYNNTSILNKYKQRPNLWSIGIVVLNTLVCWLLLS